MTNTIKIITTDNQIYQPERLVAFLYNALISNSDVVIDIMLEGPCCNTIGLYRLLDEFCATTGFKKSRIKIITANLIETHDEYNVVPNPEYWYEIKLIQQWMQEHSVQTDFLPSKHFGNFIGRSTWYRLWIASQLYSEHKEQTLQTFHSALSCNYVIPTGDGIFDTLELDLLNQFECDDMLTIIDFLQHCPLVIPENIARVKGIATHIPTTNNQCYPLQHPANLMLDECYKEIFVDIVCETKVLGRSLFLTEKTWRPILANRPFIIMTNLGALNNLRNLGFKTFNDYWDESYDDYSDQDRVREILKVIDTISKWPIEKCQSVLVDMKPILTHNYQVLKTLTVDTIKACLAL